jgi:Tol biopolymer transport system component
VDAAWAPDSQWLAYSANRDAGWWIINIVDVYGSNTQTIYGENATSSKPFWAPTGRRIGFVSMNNENYRTDMHVIDLESGSMTTLLRGVSRTSYVSWSPDGSTIAFASDYENPRSDVYLINTDGSNLRRLTPSGRFFATSMPVWSPDGKHIAFGALDASGWGVYVTDVIGHDPTRIAGGTPFAWSRN